MDIHWQINASAGCFHAAECLVRGESLENGPLAESFGPLVARLEELMALSGLPASSYLAHLVPLSAQLDSNRQLATALLGKTFGAQKSEPYVSPLTNLLTEFEGTYQRVAPAAAEELAQSAAELRRRWAAYGETLLSGIAFQIEPEVIVPSATALLVPPVCGGSGHAYLYYNSAGLEVLEADPIRELPEIVRLCWLIAQLNADLPMYQGEIHRDRLLEIVPLAMIPAALSAAAELGLARLDEPTIGRAMAAWVAGAPDVASTSASLKTWWDAYVGRKPRWPVALAALGELLPA